MNDLIERIKSDDPKFHTDRAGRLVSLSVSHILLQQLQQYLRPEIHTLETGCGATTVVFAAVGCHHCCVTPRSEEAERVTEYCRKVGIATDYLHFELGRSEHVLPRIFEAGPLDFVFIDGGHRFPYPVLDFHYTQHRLQIGGILAVDDISIPSVGVLLRFLSGEREWKRISIIEETAFFQRAEPPRDGDWTDQAFNRPSAWQRGVRRLRRMVTHN